MRKIGTVPIFFFLAAAVHAAPLGPNLYIAGDGFTLEQALGDAQRDGAKAYKILVTGTEAPRVIASRATRDTMDVVRKARADGGRIFVCVKDVKTAGITPRAPDRKSLAVCAE